MAANQSPSLADDRAFGDWLYEVVAEGLLVKRVDWVDSVAARLQERRFSTRRFQAVVVWLSDMTAFTAPGRYIYLTGRLIEYCPGDAALAFVIAHEIAHHDLGHLVSFPRWLRHLGKNRLAELGVLLAHSTQHRLYGPERENAADRRAIDLCLKAGYDGADCLRLFDQLEQRSLDMGDIDGVFGPEPGEATGPASVLMEKARTWIWQRARGYMPIRDRRRALEEHLAKRSGRRHV